MIEEMEMKAQERKDATIMLVEQRIRNVFPTAHDIKSYAGSTCSHLSTSQCHIDADDFSYKAGVELADHITTHFGCKVTVSQQFIEDRLHFIAGSSDVSINGDIEIWHIHFRRHDTDTGWFLQLTYHTPSAKHLRNLLP